ncbi:MAG: hypothetical protein FWD43_02035, partial [Coriobacteriia bacterium]|nr:hypothetical protein [Coriobacteriia bacterium]
MITSKYLPALTAVLLCICLVGSGLLAYLADGATPLAGASTTTSGFLSTGSTTKYQDRLFGDTIISLDIQVDEDDWQALLDN